MRGSRSQIIRARDSRNRQRLEELGWNVITVWECEIPSLLERLAVRGVYFDRSAISRMEAGQRFIRDYEIAAIADALGISIETLFRKNLQE
ncbi:MAG: hypothetical protein NTZ46_12155 [Verrucomicrobia bacterium]|nr:hypothetical protein [Verrucomicrobiota bacterium]